MDIKQAGKELIRFNIGNAVKSMLSPSITNFGYPSETLELRSNTYRSQGGVWYFDQPVNNDCGKDIFFPWKNNSSAIHAFENCAPFASIILRSTEAYLNGKSWIMDKKGKESNTDAAKRVRALMKQPNPLQTWTQFEANYRVYKKLFGYVVVLPIVPVGFDRTYTEQLWLMPPHYIEFEYYESNNFFKVKDWKELIRKVWFKTPDGSSTELRLNDIVILKDTFPTLGASLLPVSPVKPLQPAINNIIGAMQSRATLIWERGALGTLTPEMDPNGSRPLDPKKEEELHKKFAVYGLTRGQRKFIISPMPLKWQQMGIPTKDLMLFEEIKDDIEQICDNHGYPFELLANSKGTTFANKNEASKLLYQNTLIPESVIDSANWDYLFELEAYGLHHEKDYSHIPALQENKKDEAQARNIMGTALERDFKNNFITYNRVLEIIGEDTIPEQEGKYYRDLVDEGWVFGNTSNSNNGTGQETTTEESGQGEGESANGNQGQSS